MLHGTQQSHRAASQGRIHIQPVARVTARPRPGCRVAVPGSVAPGLHTSGKAEVQQSPEPHDALRVDERAAHAQDGGFGLTHKTKMVCTIGPATCSEDALAQLARNGMNIARLNMTHGSHAWHEEVFQRIQALNRDKGYCIAVMVDTEGSEVHTGELRAPIKTDVGSQVVFTVRDPPPAELYGCPVVGIGYGAFTDDVEVGDHLYIDGGMVELVVTKKAGPDVIAQSLEQGLILSRANVTCRRRGELIRGRSAMLSAITGKDWRDIDWAIGLGVDFLAISFVRTADALHSLRSYITQRSPGRTVELIAKLEAYDCLANMDSIIEASDGIMVARGDLGAQVPVEDVPSIQKYAVTRARQLGKPAIVAHQLLHSMIEYPVPTRAEVADVADVVRQKADALMLSGESAMGAYPAKSLAVLAGVAARMEAWGREEKFGSVVLPRLGHAPDERTSEELCASAALIANNLGAVAVLAYTRRGNMASFLSRCRPDCPIYALTDREDVRRRLSLRWGVLPMVMPLTDDFEGNVQRTLVQLKARGFVQSGDLVVVVSDIKDKPSAAGSSLASGSLDGGGGGGGAEAAGGAGGLAASGDEGHGGGAASSRVRSVQVRHVR